MLADPRIAGLVTLIAALALILGAICHSIFAAEVLAMIGVMFFGPGNSLGTVPRP